MHKKIKQSVTAAGQDVKPIVVPSSQTIAKPLVSSSAFTQVELDYLADLLLNDYFKNKSQFSNYKVIAVENLIKKIENMKV
jgi:hypothetical protein